MKSGEKVLTYLNRVKYLASTLRSTGVEIDDQEQAMVALIGPPSSYENLIVALDALGNDDRSFPFDIVKSRLIQEEQRASGTEKIPSSALYGSTASGGNLKEIKVVVGSETIVLAAPTVTTKVIQPANAGERISIEDVRQDQKIMKGTTLMKMLCLGI